MLLLMLSQGPILRVVMIWDGSIQFGVVPLHASTFTLHQSEADARTSTRLSLLPKHIKAMPYLSPLSVRDLRT